MWFCSYKSGAPLFGPPELRYEQNAQPNDKLPSVKRATLQAKRELRELKMPPWFWLAAEMSNGYARPIWDPVGTISMPELARIFVDEFAVAHFVLLWWRFDVWRFWSPKFSVFSSQNLDWDNEQLHKIEQKAQAKNSKRTTERGVKMFGKWREKRETTVKFCESSSLKGKHRKAKHFTICALAGIRVAIHRHLTCAPLNRDINILQDSEFMSANKMFQAKAKQFAKENNAKPKHKSSIQSGDR